MLSKQQSLLVGVAAAFLVVSYFFLPQLSASLAPIGEANSKLQASSDKLWLESYLACFLAQPQCRRAYDQILRSGPPFPFELGLIFMFLSGGLLVLTWVVLFRNVKRLYDGLLALLKDIRDLRTKNWLLETAAGTGLVLGNHINVPDAGPARKSVLRGHSRRGIDAQMMVVKPNYGERRELPLGAVFGTTRSGKTMHLLAQALRWTDSFIVLDIKGEIYAQTAGTAAQRAGKHRVIVLSPEGRGHQFNPLAELMKTDNGISTAASIIAAPDKETGNGKYFAQKAAQGLEAAFYAARFIDYPPFDFLYELVLAGGLGSFYGRLRAMDDPGVQLMLNKFLDPHGGDDFDLQRALNESSLTNSWSTMIKSLSPFLGENIRWLLRRSDFRASDLMKAPTYVYLQFPETTLEATASVYDLIVTGLTKGMFDYVGEELGRKKPKTTVLLLLDELYAAPVSNLPLTYSTAAARFVTPVIYCQSLEQLDEVYGETGRKTILGNCGVTLYYKTESWDMAKHISELSGKVSRTEQRKSRRWRPLPTFEAPTISEGNQSREVLTPDEIMTMGGEKREVIAVRVTGKPLIIARRVNPYKTRRLRKLMAKYPAPKIRVPKPEVLAGYAPPPQKPAPTGKNKTAATGSNQTGLVRSKPTRDDSAEAIPEVRPKAAGSVMTFLEDRVQTRLGKSPQHPEVPKALYVAPEVPNKAEPKGQTQQLQLDFENPRTPLGASLSVPSPTSEVEQSAKPEASSEQKILYRPRSHKSKRQKESST